MRMLLLKLPEPVSPLQKPAFTPPIGLWSIAHNVQRARGLQVHVVDMHLGEPLPRPENFEIIGLSVQFSIQDPVYRGLARSLREVGFTGKLISGGFHAAQAPAPPEIDEVIHGEGDSKLAGVRFEDLEYPPVRESMLSPYWDRARPHDLTSLTPRWIPMEFSRGCSRACGFCGVREFWGEPRFFPAREIESRLEALKRHGVSEIMIEDDNILSSSERFTWILGRLREYGISWSTPNGIPIHGLRRFLGSLRASGCWRVSLPFETGSQATSRLMGLGAKYVDFEEARVVVRMLRGEGILTCGFFIIGYPGETLQDMRETLSYANALPLDQRNIYIATPYPGTRLYQDCLAQGWLVSKPPKLYEDLLYTRALIRTPDFSPEDVEALRAKDREEALARRAQARKTQTKGGKG